MKNSLLPKFAPFVLLAAIGLTASGCSVVDEVAHDQKSAEFADTAALTADGGLTVPWLPDDSTAIRVTRSTQADDAAVAVASEADLSTSLCAEVPRLSAPAYAVDDTVDVYDHASVFACGEWSVVETPTGWLGWTPNHPDEKAQSPSR